MKTIGSILAGIFLSGCLSMPKTKTEAKKWFHDSGHVNKQEFEVKSVGIKTAGERVQKFSQKCLAKKVTQKSVSSGEWGPVRSEFTSTFKPSVIKQSQRVALYLQREAPKLNFVGAPEDGRYEFFAEVTKTPKGVKVYTARLKEAPGADIGLGNIQDDFETWVKGKGRFCPKIR